MPADKNSHIEPGYLRFLVDKLHSGALSADNSSQLPDGLSEFYESLFENSSPATLKSELLIFLTDWGLLQDAFSIHSFNATFHYPNEVVDDYIQAYAPYFSYYGGTYRLYHERFRVYCLQRSSHKVLVERNSRLIRWLEKYGDLHEPIYKREFIGIHFLLAGLASKALEHLVRHGDDTIQSWWVRTMDHLLDAAWKEPSTIDLTSVAELLRGGYDRKLNEKGAKLIARHADKIVWDKLESFFHGTKFTYLLAFALAEDYENLPDDWIEILLSQTHPLFYTFACTWKYLIWKDVKIELQRVTEAIKKEGSPYLRGILKEAKGGRALQNLKIIPELEMAEDIWEFVNDEKWDDDDIFKSPEFTKNLSEISSITAPAFRYITDDFRTLHLHIRKLERDYNTLSTFESSKELAWILMAHPSWEVAAYGSELLKKQLYGDPDKVRSTLEWIRTKSNQELVYSMAEFCFELIDQADFFPEFIAITESILERGSALMRGEYLSSLCNYLESTSNDQLWDYIHDTPIQRFAVMASDIWETQEFVRFLEFASAKKGKNYCDNLLSIHPILKHIPHCMNLDFNSVWKECERLKLS